MILTSVQRVVFIDIQVTSSKARRACYDCSWSSKRSSEIKLPTGCSDKLYDFSIYILHIHAELTIVIVLIQPRLSNKWNVLLTIKTTTVVS